MQLKVEVQAEKNGETVVHKSMVSAAAALGISYPSLNRRLSIKPGKGTLIPIVNGWKVTKIQHDMKALDEQRQAIKKELQRLKHEPHAPISEDLSLPYCSGLFDAEGCISILGPSSWKIGLPQGFPEVLFALKRQFGGSVFVSIREKLMLS